MEFTRWSLCADKIIWEIEKDKNLPHKDEIEISGQLISSIITYGVDKKGELILTRNLRYPTLRTIPNNTHASLGHKYELDELALIYENGKKAIEKPYKVEYDGVLTIHSKTREGLEIIRKIFSSVDLCCSVEKIEIINSSNSNINILVEKIKTIHYERGAHGIYILEVKNDANKDKFILKPKQKYEFGVYFSGRKMLNKPVTYDADAELYKRYALVKHIKNSLVFKCPDNIINKTFENAKIRTTESIYKTKGGFMHCPGGGGYYAAVWTNDQVEYAGPLFPFIGNENANKASLNAYRLYVPFMIPDYSKTIPTSIIAEGEDIWEGAGDRGDSAMYLYGVTRFLLALGNRCIAEELFPAVDWCVQFCKTKLNKYGVILSDSDELEGRFPTGDANLSTSCLAYGGLCSAVYLAKSLGRIDKAKEYDKMANELENAIENYFGYNVEGYETYRYYEGNDVLRSWICLPLAVGIFKRKKGTIDALFKSRLWTPDGLATQAGEVTFWDRATLYGFRGAFMAGETEKAIRYLKIYSTRRTLGNHVPYPVEAYPEGNQKHLASESALYCRIITEGLFGIFPIGFDSFKCTPMLPDEWDEMSLDNIKAFNNNFDIHVKRINNNKENKISTTIKWQNKIKKYTISNGETIEVYLNF